MTWCWLDGRHVARRHRRWAHAPVIHAAGHADHKKRVPWVSIFYAYMWFCFFNYGAPLLVSSTSHFSGLLSDGVLIEFSVIRTEQNNCSFCLSFSAYKCIWVPSTSVNRMPLQLRSLWRQLSRGLRDFRPPVVTSVSGVTVKIFPVIYILRYVLFFRRVFFDW